MSNVKIKQLSAALEEDPVGDCCFTTVSSLPLQPKVLAWKLNLNPETKDPRSIAMVIAYDPSLPEDNSTEFLIAKEDNTLSLDIEQLDYISGGVDDEGTRWFLFELFDDDIDDDIETTGLDKPIYTVLDSKFHPTFHSYSNSVYGLPPIDPFSFVKLEPRHPSSSYDRLCITSSMEELEDLRKSSGVDLTNVLDDLVRDVDEVIVEVTSISSGFTPFRIKLKEPRDLTSYTYEFTMRDYGALGGSGIYRELRKKAERLCST